MNKDNKVFQAAIVRRFMSAQDYVDFVSKYESSRKTRTVHGRAIQPALPSDFLIKDCLEQTKSISETARKFSTSNARVYAALARIAANV